eukprot:454424_1
MVDGIYSNALHWFTLISCSPYRLIIKHVLPAVGAPVIDIAYGPSMNVFDFGFDIILFSVFESRQTSVVLTIILKNGKQKLWMVAITSIPGCFEFDIRCCLQYPFIVDISLFLQCCCRFGSAIIDQHSLQIKSFCILHKMDFKCQPKLPLILVFILGMSMFYNIVFNHSRTISNIKSPNIQPTKSGDNYTDTRTTKPSLNLSFLDAQYYKSNIFNGKANKFLRPFEDFMSMPGRPAQGYRPNYIYFDMEYDNPKLIYCAGINLAGIGNHLAQYWTARAVAFWMGYDFVMMNSYDDDRCWQDAASEMYDKYWSNNTWSSYLIKSNNESVYDEFNTNNRARQRIWLWITQSVTQLDKEEGKKKYCYKSLIRLFWYNPLYLPIIIRDTHSALDRYFDIHPIDKVLGHNDVVIHFRCGDILSAGGDEYGFMTLQYYKEAFSNWSLTENTVVHLLSQLGDQSLRSDDNLGKHNLERKNRNGCNDIVTAYVAELHKIVSPARILIHGNNALSTDFHMMVDAPLLICSESTFCEQAALANTNSVVMPIYGPWIDLGKMRAGGIWTPSNHKFISNSLTQMTLSSSRVTSKKMNPTQIVEYLITH